MYAIVYIQDEVIDFNGDNFQRVKGIFSGDVLPENSFEITKDEYDAWRQSISSFHYINAENKTVNRAVIERSKEKEFRESRRKEIIVERMAYLWSKIQALTDLDIIDNSINSEYQNLINEYKSF